MGEGRKTPPPPPGDWSAGRLLKKSGRCGYRRRRAVFFSAGIRSLNLGQHPDFDSAMWGRFFRKNSADHASHPDPGLWVPGFGLILAGLLVLVYPRILVWLFAGTLIAAGVVTLLVGWLWRKLRGDDFGDF